MNLTIQHISYLSGVKIETILRARYLAPELAKVNMMNYLASHLTTLSMGVQDKEKFVRAFNLLTVFMQAEESATEHRTFELRQPLQWLDGMYGVYETPYTVRVYADKPDSECVHFTYDPAADDFGERMRFLK